MSLLEISGDSYCALADKQKADIVIGRTDRDAA